MVDSTMLVCPNGRKSSVLGTKRGGRFCVVTENRAKREATVKAVWSCHLVTGTRFDGNNEDKTNRLILLTIVKILPRQIFGSSN